MAYLYVATTHTIPQPDESVPRIGRQLDGLAQQHSLDRMAFGMLSAQELPLIEQAIDQGYDIHMLIGRWPGHIEAWQWNWIAKLVELASHPRTELAWYERRPETKRHESPEGWRLPPGTVTTVVHEDEVVPRHLMDVKDFAYRKGMPLYRISPTGERLFKVPPAPEADEESED